jgi:hypothetical protein
MYPDNFLVCIDKSNKVKLKQSIISGLGLGQKHFLTFRENENFHEMCHSFREISSIFRRKFFMNTFREKFSRKPQSDEKWYKISLL